MKRTKYGLNCQWHNANQVQYLIPMGYFEVVPGDSMSGMVNFRYITDTTSKLVLNRAYFDVYAFYVPFRLLWDGFPDWLINGIGTLPTVNNVAEWNFEKQLCAGGAGFNTLNTAWLRRAIGTIWNEYFKRDNAVAVSIDANTRRYSSFRPSTFHEAVPESDAAFLTPEVAASLSTDDIREAFNTDAFNKVRAYYGNKYVDYLASLGVTTSWSILDEPELLGKKLSPMKYQIINITDSTSPADPNGYWQGTVEMPLSRHFFPEHGLVCFIANSSIDPLFAPAQPPILGMNNPSDYWSPEKDGSQFEELTNRIWVDQAHALVQMPKWERLRKGMNLTGQDQVLSELTNYIYTPNATNVTQFETNLSKTIFTGNIGNIPGTSTPAEILATADYKLVKMSPVGTRTGNPLR